MVRTRRHNGAVAPTDPLDLLARQHEEGMHHLLILENAAYSIRANGFSPEAFEQIAATVRWMNNEVRRHMESEERFLFPLIAHHVRNLAEQMRGEHRDLWDAFSELINAVSEVEEGRLRGSSIQDVVTIATRIGGQMRSHIQHENNILFPATREILTDEEYKALTEGILQVPS